MQCPQCSELQISDELRFCRSCEHSVLEGANMSEVEKSKNKSMPLITGVNKGFLMLIIGVASTVLLSLFWDVGAPLEIIVRLFTFISFLFAIIGVLQILRALQLFDFSAINYLFGLIARRPAENTFNQTKADADNEQDTNLNQKFDTLLQKFKPAKKYLDRVTIKSTEEVIFLKAAEIDWIEPTGNYLKIHNGKETHLLRETMNSFEAKLDPKMFVRIQRSAIVNVERIKKLHPLFRGEYEVILSDGTRLTSSRGYRPKLQKVFGADL
jgi:DNA-binding LytR/AlgR family response regulator